MTNQTPDPNKGSDKSLITQVDHIIEDSGFLVLVSFTISKDTVIVGVYEEQKSKIS